MKLKIQHYFDASHQLPDTINLCTKACARLHGHTYKVVVEIEGNNNRSGMVIDFKAVKDIIDIFDHRHVNDILIELGYIDVEATAENIAIVLYNKIKIDLNINVKSVAIAEGYKGEDKASWVIYPE